MKALDVRKSQTVVVYDKAKGWFATRGAFMLRIYGHPKVYVLDGGYAKWAKEGRATESADVVDYEDEYAYELSTDKLVTYEQVRQAESDGSMQIIENRPKPMVEKTGTMQGAFVMPSPSLLQEDGTMKTEA